MPSLGAYWSATPGSSRSSFATISFSTSVGNVVGLGNPPATDRTPGGEPARIVASSVSPWLSARCENARVQSLVSTVDIDLEPQAALLSAVQRRDVLGPVGEVVQRNVLMPHRLEHRTLGAADVLRPLERGAEALGGRDRDPVVVGEDDVAGVHVDAAAR